jgi:DNA-nicking Smr family endonuclease
MARRRLSPEEEALWHALSRTVRPMHRVRRAAPPAPVETPPPPAALPASWLTKAAAPAVSAPPARTPAPVLDTSWERRIRSGALSPDMSIDLHGHTLAMAHARLHQALGDAVARDVRVLLVVTGKPPKIKGLNGPPQRGAIRGEIGHWLETSPFADRIASVRVAHPRHGGDGALYLILRRRK